MAAKLTPELKAAFRKRIRHIHLPDRAPHYAPRSLPGNLRDFLESQILRQRNRARSDSANLNEGELEHAIDSHALAATGDDADVVRGMYAWLRRASPPPTVLSFTRRPTYVLPKHYLRSREPWEVDYLTKALKSKQQVTFPRPPMWHEPAQILNGVQPDLEKLLGASLSAEWEPGVMTQPAKEPMYFGPGQISIWPVIDLLDLTQRGKNFASKYEYERILEDTTIQVLKREYGLDAFAIPGKQGVWVETLLPPHEISESDPDSFGIDTAVTVPKKYENTRRIATIHTDIVDDITRFGVSIHVGEPHRTSPWAPIRQDEITTTIISELAMKGSVPHRRDPEQQELEHRSDLKSQYLQTVFDKDSVHISKPMLAMPFSMIAAERARRKPYPLGLDNRDLSVAWTFEFARQLGLAGGLIDFLSMVDYNNGYGKLPAKTWNIGFMSRQVMQEDAVVEPYYQVEIPIIKLKAEGPVTQEIVNNTRLIEGKDEQLPPARKVTNDTEAVSWPMYYHKLTEFLEQSFRGQTWDTRLSQLIKDKQSEARIAQRWQAIDRADDLRDAVRNEQKKPRVQELPESLIADVERELNDTKAMLHNLRPGHITVPKHIVLKKMDKLINLVVHAKLAPPALLDLRTDSASAPPSEEAEAAYWHWQQKLQTIIESMQMELQGNTSKPSQTTEPPSSQLQLSQPQTSQPQATSSHLQHPTPSLPEGINRIKETEDRILGESAASSPQTSEPYSTEEVAEEAKKPRMYLGRKRNLDAYKNQKDRLSMPAVQYGPAKEARRKLAQLQNDSNQASGGQWSSNGPVVLSYQYPQFTPTASHSLQKRELRQRQWQAQKEELRRSYQTAVAKHLPPPTARARGNRVFTPTLRSILEKEKELRQVREERYIQAPSQWSDEEILARRTEYAIQHVKEVVEEVEALLSGGSVKRKGSFKRVGDITGQRESSDKSSEGSKEGFQFI